MEYDRSLQALAGTAQKVKHNDPLSLWILDVCITTKVVTNLGKKLFLSQVFKRLLVLGKSDDPVPVFVYSFCLSLRCQHLSKKISSIEDFTQSFQRFSPLAELQLQTSAHSERGAWSDRYESTHETQMSISTPNTQYRCSKTSLNRLLNLSTGILPVFSTSRAAKPRFSPSSLESENANARSKWKSK